MKYIFAFFLLTISPLYSAEDLSLSEFQALAKKGATLEVLSNARRVKPSERNDEWDRIVSQSAKDLFGRLENETDRQFAYEIGRELSISHKPLQSDREFMYRLGELGVLTYSTKGIAAPMFEKALIPNDPRCKAEGVRAAVTDAFTRPGMELEKKSAQVIAFNLCAKVVDASWGREMVESEYGMKSACAGLLKLKVLTGVKKKKCEASVKESK